MGYVVDGMKVLLSPSRFSAMWNFDRDLQRADGNMQVACESFFDRLGYRVELDRRWTTSSGGILFFGDHPTALDGFAMALACPKHLTCRRTMFTLSACLLGKNVRRSCVTVWPRGNYHNLVYKTGGFVDRVSYLISHRWGPWVRPGQALHRMCNRLSDGECLTLLPSGTVGEQHWRSGIGSIILNCMERESRLDRDQALSLRLAPVYLEWNHHQKVVTVRAPRLISFAEVCHQVAAQRAGEPCNRDHVTTWLQSQYRDDDWG
ncbi:MAG: hypothetical protein R3C03_18130 [Pirellulaceae bacterium]